MPAIWSQCCYFCFQFELLGDTYVELVIDKVNIPRDLVSGDVSLTEDDEDVCAIRKNEKVLTCTCMSTYYHGIGLLLSSLLLLFVFPKLFQIIMFK